MITGEEEMQRMTLYKQGMNDTEIAERLGVTRVTICRWRNRKGLPPNVKSVNRPIKRGIQPSAKMEEALPPEKCIIMKKFLHDLVEYSKMLPTGVKPDISAFLWEWRRTYSYRSEPGRTVKKRRSLS